MLAVVCREAVQQAICAFRGVADSNFCRLWLFSAECVEVGAPKTPAAYSTLYQGWAALTACCAAPQASATGPAAGRQAMQPQGCRAGDTGSSTCAYTHQRVVSQRHDFNLDEFCSNEHGILSLRLTSSVVQL
jgi:hypothetical protein